MDDDTRRLLDLYPRIFFACHRRHTRDASTGVTLSAHQCSILDHLDLVHPLTLNSLAQHMGVTPATMSIHIDRLEGLGYVARVRDREDARKVQLRLTRKGERIKSAQSVLDPCDVASLLCQLEPEDRRRALDGLALLAQAAGSMMKAKKNKRVDVGAPPKDRS